MGTQQLPKALAGQNEAVEALHRQMYSNKEGEAPVDTAPAAQETQTPPEQTPPQEAPPAQAEAPPPVDPIEEETWEQRYKTLIGKYNKEMGDALGRIKFLESQMVAGQAPQQADADTDETAREGDELSTAERIARITDEYGEDFVKDMEAHFATKFKSMLEPMERTVDAITRVTAQTADERYRSDLKAMVPDFEQIVADPGFKTFLDQSDPFSGLRRMDLARDAKEKRDAKRVAQFYLAYKAESGNGATQPPQQQQRNVGRPTDPREALMAPNSTAGTAESHVSPQDDVPYVKTSEMEAFARDLIRGAYVGRDEERRRIQARHDAAQLTPGRIIVDT